MLRTPRIILLCVFVLSLALLPSCARKETSTAGPTTSSSTTSSSTASSAGATERPTTPSVQSSPTPKAAGIADVGTEARPTSLPQVYVVQAGDTLYAIASKFGCDVNDLIEVNQIANASLLQVGQQLKVPSTDLQTGPSAILLPNSEFVNSPAYLDFDVQSFSAQHGGYLASYQERVNGVVMTGPEILEYVVHHYSVGPRMLLAVMETKSGWVTNPNPVGEALARPLGFRGAGWDSLHYQLAWAADKLNQGYYDWRGRGMQLNTWGDGTAIHYSPDLNAATAGLQYFFSQNATKGQWQAWLGDGPDSFKSTYRALFGDPEQYAIEPLIPADTQSPVLVFPWAKGATWYYTGGPHGSWNEGSAWGAIDVVPGEGYLGCRPASAPATAAAPGLVVYSNNGEVKIDLDGDGHEETGWVLFYLHVDSQGRVPAGTRVQTGDIIGHPSCEGGFSESTHLHFARKYNGEWMAAGGPLPLVLSGWQFHSSGSSYDGTATRDGQERTACECWQDDYNGFVADR